MRVTSMKAALAAAGLLGSICAIAVPSAASATTPARSGTEHIRIVQGLSGPGTIIIKGPYSDGGLVYDHGPKSLAVFPHGTFTIKHPGGDFTFSINPRTCIAKFSGTGD